MNDKNTKVLTNIIGAEESGGQVYGNRCYEAYAGPYTHSSNGVTCTFGWSKNHGNEGRNHCQMVLKKDTAAFRKADTANIESKLSVDWVAAKCAPTTAQKNALIAIITTPAGKECQDALFAELMEEYIENAVEYGVTDVKAQMIWCEIEHLGGLGPTKRIFDRAAKPYTPDSIFESLIKDQQDTSNDNQVGDKKFQSRHECCVKWIKQYAVEEGGTSVGVTAQDVLNVMRSWLGYNESNGKYKQIIDLYNSHKTLARGDAVQYDDEWGDTSGTDAANQAGAVDLIGTECGCEEHIKIFKDKGIWIEDGTITPEPGYIILYNWGDSKQPNDGYSDHIGYVESVSSGKITAIEGNKGGAVARRTISVGHGNIRGYAAPKYADVSGSGTPEKTEGGNYMFECKTVQSGEAGTHVLLVQEILRARGYKGKDGKDLTLDRECGPNTVYAIKNYQRDREKVDPGICGGVDGIAGEKTLKDMSAL